MRGRRSYIIALLVVVWLVAFGASPASATSSIAVYQPSTVVSQNAGYELARTGDPVAKVTAFYDHLISANGWHVVSVTKTNSSSHYIIKRGHTGVTMATSSTGSGASISITTYGV